MDLHRRHQFDLLLHAAVERLTERATQRCEGAAHALDRLRADPDGEGVWLGEFVDAFFQDSLLDNAAGACFVLHALEKRPAAAPLAGTAEAPPARIADLLQTLARRAFRDLVAQKAEEALSQSAAYGG